MRRFLLRLVPLALVAGTLAVGSSVAHAAPGNVTSTAVTPPSALAGLTVTTAVSSRDGGMYYAYASGTDYKVFKTKPNGTLETTFGVNGIADVPGVVTSLTGTRRLVMTSGLDGRWWVVNVVSVQSGSPQNSDIRIVGGGSTGAPDIDFVITQSASWAACAAAYPDITGVATWSLQSVTVHPKRGGGMWVSAFCTAFATVGGSVGTENRTMIVSFSDKGVQGTAAPVGLTNALGSTSPCHNIALVSDPTGAAGSPEIYAVRTEYTKFRTGSTTSCELATQPNAAEITGYSVVKISSDGTTSTWNIASAGDASDGILAARIDPGGRLVLVNTNVADTSRISIRRLKTDGTLDTTVGSGGIRSLEVGTAPAGQSSVNATVSGIITTPTKVYLAILLNDLTKTGVSCASTSQVTFGYRYVVASPSDGLLTSWGTSGVGDRTTLTLQEKDVCGRQTSGGRSVDTDGQPRLVRFEGGNALLDVWTAPTGTNGGGDGGTGSGGPTTDTGGAPSKGDGLQVSLPKSGGTSTGTSGESRVDAKTYRSLPAAMSSLTAVTVLTAQEAQTLALKSRTQDTCVAVDRTVLFTAAGACTVRITSKASGDTVRVLRTTVSRRDNGKGTTFTVGGTVTFGPADWRLSAAAKKTVAAVAGAAAGSSRVVVVGHSAALYDTRAYNFGISAKRADAVRKALKRAGLKSPVTTVNAGWNDPVTTKKTESAQSRNRRVVVYVFPAAAA